MKAAGYTSPPTMNGSADQTKQLAVFKVIYAFYCCFCQNLFEPVPDEWIESVFIAEVLIILNKCPIITVIK